MASGSTESLLRQEELMNRFSRRFYARDTVDVAIDLLGRTLVHDSSEGLTAGRIVEVEAYRGVDDPASHAFGRVTPRNSVMYGPPGHLYVYLSYGMHYCSNIVCEKDGVAGAVLLRAVEPTDGVDLMLARRGGRSIRDLARGPGRLCQAFGIGPELNRQDLVSGEVWVGGRKRLASRTMVSQRIGINEASERFLRFYEEGPWVSGRKMPSRPMDPP